MSDGFILSIIIRMRIEDMSDGFVLSIVTRMVFQLEFSGVGFSFSSFSECV